MAQLRIRLQPPDAFNFQDPEKWSCWKRRFEQFWVTSGLKEEGAEKQVSMLLYCLGEEAEAVLASTNIKEDECKVYDTQIRNKGPKNSATSWNARTTCHSLSTTYSEKPLACS